LATCFSYNEPSSGQQQNEVPVHSVNVHYMGCHLVYNDMIYDIYDMIYVMIWYMLWYGMVWYDIWYDM